MAAQVEFGLTVAAARAAWRVRPQGRGKHAEAAEKRRRETGPHLRVEPGAGAPDIVVLLAFAATVRARLIKVVLRFGRRGLVGLLNLFAHHLHAKIGRPRHEIAELRDRQSEAADGKLALRVLGGEQDGTGN